MNGDRTSALHPPLYRRQVFQYEWKQDVSAMTELSPLASIALPGSGFTNLTFQSEQRLAVGETVILMFIPIETPNKGGGGGAASLADG